MLSAAGNWKESFAPVGKGGRTTAPLLEKLRIMVGSLERVPSVKMATLVASRTWNRRPGGFRRRAAERVGKRF